MKTLWIIFFAVFPFSTIEPNRTGIISKWDVPLNRWCELKFEHGRAHTIGALLFQSNKETARLSELHRQAYFASADHGSWSLKAFAGTGALLTGHLAHPIDFGLFALAAFGLWRLLRKSSRHAQQTAPSSA